ncbi:TIGR01777 family protein [Anoxybacillus flavithermus]|uniref:TIGR01777 family protein n=1 Tax=Anoxybacillus flavithermus TaxID=33934 RepID=A0A2G5RN49_9BACL|nr:MULTISPECIES: TIGR01777 family oxidoreductase [Anoxybacillus]KFZ42848.1 multidrug MFS transporter [Anoxybacillus sp. KU2-6(11)]PIC04156.1 TIGR01777 family protein [Anoxybacillus flavithermus]
MNILIAGGTGFVGKALTAYFTRNGHHMYILTRNAQKRENDPYIHYVQWLTADANPHEQLPSIDVVINLAGESINSGRWNETRKHAIMESRLQATHAIYELIAQMNKKPSVVIQASAIGIYGTWLNETFTERHETIGIDFLAQTVKRWEEAGRRIESLGVRTVFMRFGIILGKSGGALPRIVLPYKWFIGGTIGSGKQWMSWVHIDDVIGAIDFAIRHEDISGPINVTAPHPVTMEQFGKTIANILHRPHWLPVPSFALKVLLGEMSMLVLEGQRVIPEKLLQAGYHFSFPTVDRALANILQS